MQHSRRAINLGSNDSSNVLLIEEETKLCRELRIIFNFLGYNNVVGCGSTDWQEYLEQNQPVRFFILGNCGSEQARLDVYHQIRKLDPFLPIVLLTDKAKGRKSNLELEVGALSSVKLPLTHQDVLSTLQRLDVYYETRKRKTLASAPELFRNLVGDSAGIKQVRTLIDKVAPSSASVLVLGESGTGKEVISRHIHYYSKRRNKPFIPVNCGAIPAELLESELFGHEKGAFTGAIAARQGRFEMASGGTLFLDEIGEMSPSMQVKLLRVLQEQTFERLGSSKTTTVDVRVIAATHVDLEKAMQNGEFREDLYYRLNVFPIEAPPLRDRADDLALLVNDLSERLNHEGYSPVRLTPMAMTALSTYSWPGNVRELANLIERLAVLYPSGVVDIQDLPEKYKLLEDGSQLISPAGEPASAAIPSAAPGIPSDGIDLKEHLSTLEYNIINRALDESDWIVSRAAKRLSLGRTTLVEKMRKFGLHRSDNIGD